MNFELSLREEISVYTKSGLTPTELFIIRLLYLAADGDPSLLTEYLSQLSDGKTLLRQVLISLKNKSAINSTFKIPEKGESLNFKNIPFNKHFLNMFVRESNQIGKEFFDAYPPFININGKIVSIRNFTKANLFSFEDFCVFYAKAIKNSAVKHEYILEILEYAKANSLIHYSILEFLSSKKWEEIEYIKNSGNVNGYKNSDLL